MIPQVHFNDLGGNGKIGIPSHILVASTKLCGDMLRPSCGLGISCASHHYEEKQPSLILLFLLNSSFL